MKSKAMAKDYQALFGGLAKEFATLVAGSIVLPEPSIRDGQLMPAAARCSTAAWCLPRWRTAGPAAAANAPDLRTAR
jgi:hypothetical protein